MIQRLTSPFRAAKQKVQTMPAAMSHEVWTAKTARPFRKMFGSDVAKGADRLNIVVLHTGTWREDVPIRAGIERLGHKATRWDLKDVATDGAGNFTHKGKPVKKLPDAAIMYHGAISPEGTSGLLDALEAAGVGMVNKRVAWETATDKFKTFQHLKAQGVPTPETMLASTADDLRRGLEQFGPGPVVLKARIGTQGEDIVKVSPGDDLEAIAAEHLDADNPWIVQQMANSRNEATGRHQDTRAVFVKKPDGEMEFQGAFGRAAQPGQWITNIIQGGDEISVTLHPADMAMAKDAAQKSGLDIVGLDLIGPEGKQMILEGNSGPGIPKFTPGIDSKAMMDAYARYAAHVGAEARAARSAG